MITNIFCTSENLDITFVDSGEQTKECVFSLNENLNNINNKFTFNCSFKINNYDIFKNNIDFAISNNKIKNLENCFLFYSFYYQISYCHFLTNTLPKLCDYITKYSDLTIVIPHNMFNQLIKDIFEKCNIFKYKLLKCNKIYKIKNLISIPHYAAPPSLFVNSHIYIYNKIRETLDVCNERPKTKKIYLKRDNCINTNFNNSETGILRQIINENELIEFLKTYNYEIITLGSKTISEKNLLLNDAKIIITPLGANCMNFIFSNAPYKIIYLSNNNNFGDTYFTNLSKILNNNYPIESILLRFDTEYNLDLTNKWNGSYSVNLNALKKYI